ncbi:MAG: acetyl-CoA carboxylase carboxyltransferase subunit alpha [Candidatus Marinimicrobia bacterium]|jgi:acetyl-CoA carboxylase carboxyl transferase subunit alpha|nr:acetyl-CoA carboxylase carboxyltransferase subunit alpha [Candidatus Neomarinimicrobiota bacterium]MDP6569389.1 acetyl-CoA carboxylase carboxyltransferase subunit alpha [Candidatus Neomarinimicrobiota bacterium]MDP7025788.1 acetyl-CoA carboxylase carboxyltransferase subunit alpha [Candidatus Neomarinimicrobiota bacterium]|tara:strand:+ start:166 stop:1128 length:963 start_codon:yes stop_codon:yes gene_type:complete
MAEFHLDFEKPIVKLDDKIETLRSKSLTGKQDFSGEISQLNEERQTLIKEIYSNLTRWQRVQLARHPRRPYSLDYITRMSPDFLELHGDRHFSDDKSLVAGIGTIDGIHITYIGQQKGKNTKENLYRNFGMSKPEGYRKALRIMKMSAKYNRPVVCLLDTPGAYPGLGAEERGQAEAIARNLLEMTVLPVPILIIVIGEGASGGALGVGIGDRLLMLENTWFSVISPEGCASILWRDAGKAEEAAEALKVTASDLKELEICDRIIEEPLGGAHRNKDEVVQTVKNIIVEELQLLSQFTTEELIDIRHKKYERIGHWQEVS